jgi:hypothetical protein
MRQMGWMGRAKALAATTALACGLFGASVAAHADYSYTFTISPFGVFGGASGAFTTNDIVSGPNSYTITSGNYTFSLNSQSYTGTVSNPGSSLFVGQLQFAGFGAAPASNSLSATGRITSYSNTGFSGTVSASASAVPASGPVTASSTSALFEAFLGPSSGGGGGGGGGGSGGVPSPEVNASLGMLLAGATFVFLRRKSGSRRGPAAA